MSKLFIAMQPLTGLWQPFIGNPANNGRGWMFAPIDPDDGSKFRFRQAMSLKDAERWIRDNRTDLKATRAKYGKRTILVLD